MPTNLVDQDIVRVVINVANRVVSCQLLDSFPDTTPFVFSITYGPSPNNCTMNTNSSMLNTGRRGDTVTIGLLENLLSKTDYGYTVSVSYGLETLVVRGVFRTSKWVSDCKHCVRYISTKTSLLLVCNPEELGSDPTSTNSSGIVIIPSGQAKPSGQVEYNGVTPGSIATLACNDGYEPVAGSSNRTCMNDGNWSGDQQNCTIVTKEEVCKLIKNYNVPLIIHLCPQSNYGLLQ